VNESITSPDIRLIGHDGEMIGLVTPSEGIRRASALGLDLVEISPTATPPVCKIMDFGKFKYEMQKKAHEAKKKQKVIEIKEIKVRPTIADGDYQIKVRNATKFIQDGNKVRVSLMFRGREVTHNEVGFAVMTRFQDALSEVAKIEVPPKMEGKQIFMMLSPK
jgi:translation initiation factor IF-3